MIRNIPAEFASVQRGEWQISVGGDLEGKTIGLVGLGNIGARIAKIAHAFGMNVLAWSQNLTRESAEEHGAHLVSKDELFRAIRHCDYSSSAEPAHERNHWRDGDRL